MDLDAILRLCTKITAEAHGIIDMSSHLAPNTVLLLGQNETIDRFKELMREALGKQVHLRKNAHKWPPLAHVDPVEQEPLEPRRPPPCRRCAGGFIAPVPPILSMVNGKVAYNDYNSRSIMNRWVDQPQRMWDSINELLTLGIDLILHVGPEPNLIPATFQRISENVNAQVNRWSIEKQPRPAGRDGHRAASLAGQGNLLAGGNLAHALRRARRGRRLAAGARSADNAKKLLRAGHP